MRPAPHLIAAALAAIGVSACATASVDVGYLTPTSGDDGYDMWVVEGRAATGGIVKVGLAARSKLGEVRDQLSLAPELSVEMSPGPVTVGARLGVSMLQLDLVDDEWTVGFGSPYLQPLVQFRIGDPVYLFVGGTLEYQLASDDGPNQLMVGAQLGLGIDL